MNVFVLFYFGYFISGVNFYQGQSNILITEHMLDAKMIHKLYQFTGRRSLEPEMNMRM